MGFVSRVGEICRHCAGKRVLHLGCADWPYTEDRIQTKQLLHSEIARVSAHVIGVDMSQEGLDRMRQLEPNWELHLADACTFQPATEVDVIVASELIEHLENPGDLLRGIARWATPRQELIITTPNANGLKGAVRALFGQEFCHPDHTVLFSTQTIRQLLDRCGWQAQEVMYYECAPQSGLSAIPGYALQMLSTVLSARSGDGLVVVARQAVSQVQGGAARKAA